MRTDPRTPSSSSRRRRRRPRRSSRRPCSDLEAAAAVVRVGHLRGRRHDTRAHARPRRVDQRADVDDGDGAPHVRGALAGRARRHPRPVRRRRRQQRARAARRPAEGPRTSRPASSSNATDLVALAREIDAFSVGVAVHPEGHPASTRAWAKTAAGRPRSSPPADFGLSQFFFEPQVWFDFVDDLDRLGVTTPVTPGIMPVTNVKSVKRMAELSGADFPEWLEQRLRAVEDDPDAMHRVGVEAATELCEALPRRRGGALPLLHAQPQYRDARDLRQPRPRRLNRPADVATGRDRAPHDRGARTCTQWRREWDLNPR